MAISLVWIIFSFSEAESKSEDYTDLSSISY